ncbi:hypothetical protein [Nostoc sp. CHAB 5715]|nr:hypothetical protein [Nostoc sp. CHAB 5715]
MGSGEWGVGSGEWGVGSGGSRGVEKNNYAQCPMPNAQSLLTNL